MATRTEPANEVEDVVQDAFDEVDEKQRTGHALHFLGRLSERANEAEQALALRLYRDKELVRRILADASSHAAPDERAAALAAGGEGEERWALPLGAEAGSAHAVVSADLGFVTFLGAEMYVKRLPRVPWERVEQHLLRRDREHEQHQRLDALLAEQPTLTPLLNRIVRSGAGLTRQEFQKLGELAPVFGADYLRFAIEALLSLRQHGTWVARIKKAHAADDTRALRAFWLFFHTVGHGLALTGVRGRQGFAVWNEPKVREDMARRGSEPFRQIYLEAVKLGYAPTALRALWAVARAGGEALRAMKDALAEARTLDEWCAASAGLVAIGARHRKLRAECVKALDPARLPGPWRSLESMVRIAETNWGLLAGDKVLPRELDPQNEEHMAWWRSETAPFFDKMYAELSAHPLWLPGAEGLADLPEDQKLAGLFYLPYVGAAEGLGVVTALLTAVIAPASEADLYLDEAHAHLAPAFSPEAALALAHHWRPQETGPARAGPKVGRNEPCPCGSGKKYKKCCVA